MGVSHQPTKFPVQSLSTIDRSEDLYAFGLTHALGSVTDMYIPSLHLYGTNISQPNKNDPRAADVQTEEKGDDRRAMIRTVSERGKGIRCHAYVSASGLVSVEQDE